MPTISIGSRTPFWGSSTRRGGAGCRRFRPSTSAPTAAERWRRWAEGLRARWRRHPAPRGSPDFTLLPPLTLRPRVEWHERTSTVTRVLRTVRPSLQLSFFYRGEHAAPAARPAPAEAAAVAAQPFFEGRTVHTARVEQGPGVWRTFLVPRWLRGTAAAGASRLDVSAAAPPEAAMAVEAARRFEDEPRPLERVLRRLTHHESFATAELRRQERIEWIHTLASRMRRLEEPRRPAGMTTVRAPRSLAAEEAARAVERQRAAESQTPDRTAAAEREPQMPLLDMETLASNVMRQIDRRLVAQRERMGRI